MTWCVLATSLGAESVRFCGLDRIQDWKYPKEMALSRFENILKPVCSLFGLPYSVGERVDGFTCGHHYGQVNMFHKRHGIKKLPLNDSYGGYVTVTIRDSIRFKSRDSNRKEWDRLIRWLEKSEKVVVLEDREKDPICVIERMKLYSGAKMNLGVSNGPMALCHFSDAPYLTFKMIPEGEGAKELRDHMARGGFPEGSQLAFRTKKQELVWELDTFETMKRVYERV